MFEFYQKQLQLQLNTLKDFVVTFRYYTLAFIQKKENKNKC